MNSQELLDKLENESNPLNILIGALNLLKNKNRKLSPLQLPQSLKKQRLIKVRRMRMMKAKTVLTIQKRYWYRAGLVLLL